MIMHACVLDSDLQEFLSFTVPQTPRLLFFYCSTITGPVGAVWLHSHRQHLDQEEEDYREPYGGINARCAGELGAPTGHVTSQRCSQEANLNTVSLQRMDENIILFLVCRML